MIQITDLKPYKEGYFHAFPLIDPDIQCGVVTYAVYCECIGSGRCRSAINDASGRA
jgi:hypothetical protein